MSASVHYFPNYDCAVCGARVYNFPAVEDVWTRDRQLLLEEVGIGVEEPTCMHCIIERLRETADAPAH